jgi:hypothetical protein
VKNFNRTIAWKTTQALFFTAGGTGMVAFAATLQWWLVLMGIGVVGLTWFMIYKLLEGLSRDSKPSMEICDTVR